MATSPPQHHHADDRPLVVNCPRCGLSVRQRTAWLAMEHCPRCLARAGIAVELRVASVPTSRWRVPPDPDRAWRRGVHPRARA